MGASRTSNKDILDAINAQTEALAGLTAAIAGTITPAAPETTPVVTEATEAPVNSDVPSTVRVKPQYLSHMKAKAQDHANSKGEAVVLYGRVNMAGEHKLAYCLKSRWTSLKDRGLIGAVAEFAAS